MTFDDFLAEIFVRIKGLANRNGSRFREAIEGDSACRLGLEGIVSKRLGSAYASGRRRNWLRVKNPAFERR